MFNRGNFSRGDSMKKIAFFLVFLLSFVLVFSSSYKGIEFEDWKQILEHGTVAEKKLALEAFGYMIEVESENILLDYLQNENEELKYTAIWSLGQLASEKAAEEIAWMIGESNDVRIDGALINIGLPSVKYLNLKLKLAGIRDDIDQGMRISRILVDIQDPSGMVEVSTFLTRLLSSEIHRNIAMDMLMQIGEKAIEPLSLALKMTYDNNLKVGIINTLATIGDQRALDTLYEYYTDSDPNIRSNVANALGKIKSPRNSDFLIAMMRDTDDNVKMQAIVSLGSLKDSSAVIYLLSTMNDENPIIRAVSAYSLGQIKDVRAVYPLINMLDDNTILKIVNPVSGRSEESYVSSFAIEALKKIKDPRGLEELERRGIK